ncbi:MAG: hypothetical protein U9N85_07575 [Bacteroidota bacterium]|nr:hypothetical protein [Bacteroidota bacterium]
MRTEKAIYIKSAKINYNNYNLIEILDIREFLKIFEYINKEIITNRTKNQMQRSYESYALVKEGLVFISDDSFIVINDNYLFRISKAGFVSLEDYIESEQSNQLNSDAFYNSKALKFGYNNSIDYFDAVDNGFIDASKQFNRNNHYNNRKSPFNGLTDAEIYYKIKKQNYKTFLDYQKGQSKGFKDGIDFYNAQKLGFIEYDHYITAKELDIKNAQDYYELSKKGIETKEQIEFYRWSKKIDKSNYQTYDELALIKYLVDMPKSRTTLKKIYENYKKILENIFDIPIPSNQLRSRTPTYGNIANKPKNELYNVTISNVNQLKKVINENNLIKFIGTYDEDGDFFEKLNSLNKSERYIYIDGSNMAYIINNEPYAKSIQIIVKHLISLGFNKEKINVIVDKSLKHKIKDKDNFNRLKDESNYYEAPAKTDADDYIIKYAKENNGIIISNDRYNDYSIANSWVAHNIDRIRIPVMIIEDKPKFKGNINDFL